MPSDRADTPSPGVRVLVVDDEEGITSLVQLALTQAGFDCATSATGADAITQAHAVDVLVLDWMLPDREGIDIAAELRAAGHRTRVLMLTARDSLDDRLAGLSVAHDYLVKPFEVAELVARVRNLAAAASTPGTGHGTGVRIDRASITASVNGTPLALTPAEFRLLAALLDADGAVLLRTDAYQQVWQYDFGGARANLDTLVSGLRRKLVDAGCSQLHTVRGYGYRLAR